MTAFLLSVNTAFLLASVNIVSFHSCFLYIVYMDDRKTLGRGTFHTASAVGHLHPLSGFSPRHEQVLNLA